MQFQVTFSSQGEFHSYIRPEERAGELKFSCYRKGWTRCRYLLIQNMNLPPCTSYMAVWAISKTLNNKIFDVFMVPDVKILEHLWTIKTVPHHSRTFKNSQEHSRTKTCKNLIMRSWDTSRSFSRASTKVKTVPGRSRPSKNRQEYSRTSKNIPGRPKIFKKVQEHSKLALKPKRVTLGCLGPKPADFRFPAPDAEARNKLSLLGDQPLNPKTWQVLNSIGHLIAIYLIGRSSTMNGQHGYRSLQNAKGTNFQKTKKITVDCRLRGGYLVIFLCFKHAGVTGVRDFCLGRRDCADNSVFEDPELIWWCSVLGE
ncbi:unnamed protein product [Nesidiocoris tenuis]|uniref:Uncharacterized protein n=1 Tax=Nesidiocoris tenuis TaxID=355587 RepID=A0A6H5GN40_9HEMI|nr:unnamed protein product [Nesidiocoris tenuis]